MIQQFLQLGGVRTIEEFYKKFPTEAHFDHHVHKMKYGGGLYAYGGGGNTPPDRGDYMDNEEQYQADMDAWLASQTFSNAPIKTAARSSSKPSPYGGVSIVDLLASKGKAFNKASRKKLAESLGIQGYTGRASENKALITAINNNPEILDDYETIDEPKRIVTTPVKKAAPTPVKKSTSVPVTKSTTKVAPTSTTKPVSTSITKVTPPPALNSSNSYQPTKEEIDAYIASENARMAKENPYVMASTTPPPPPPAPNPWGINQGKKRTDKIFLDHQQKTQTNNTPASTNNFQRYPGRGTSFGFDYNTYEGRPDQAVSATSQNSSNNKSNESGLDDKVDQYKQMAQNWITRHVSADPESEAKAQSVLKKPQVVVSASNQKETPALPPIIIGNPLVTKWNERHPDTYHAPVVADLNRLKLGVRNRGEYNEVNSAGYLFGGLDPDDNPRRFIDSNKINPNAFYMGIDANNKFVSGFGKDLKGQKGLKLMDFKLIQNVSGVAKDKTGKLKLSPSDAVRNSYSASWQDSKGNSIGAVGPVTYQDEASQSSYGDLTGGHVVLMSPDFKKKILISGSIKDIDREIEAFKKENNLTSFHAVQVDNGSAAQNVFKKNKKLTKKDWKDIEARNKGIGGSGFYLLGDGYKFGGEPCYECGGGMYEHGGYYGNVPQHGQPQGPNDGTYYQGNFFDDGGYVPEYGPAAYGLPQYNLGASFAYGGSHECPPGMMWEPLFNTCVPIKTSNPSVIEQRLPTSDKLDGKTNSKTMPSMQTIPGSFKPVNSQQVDSLYNNFMNSLPPHELNHSGSYKDGGSPLYSTQGQALRNFMNTVGYTPGGWMPNHIELPPVGPRRYDDGGGAPVEQVAPPGPGQAPDQGPPQGSSGIDPQQVMQIVAQKLQQGEQPQQIMQELVQAGVPQDQAQQIIQQVMQEMQGAQGQQAAEEQQESFEQQSPEEEMQEGAPQAMYGMGMKYGGTKKSYEVGGEYNVSNSDIKKLIAQGYKIQYI